MNCKIYTYSNPFEINKEKYWGELMGCPYFCATQTLVEGLRKVYPKELEDYKGITTVRNLINSIYENWNSVSTFVNQYAIVDKIINNYSLFDCVDISKLSKSFLRNRKEVLQSIRILFELNVDENNIIFEKLTEEQKYLVEVYRYIKNHEIVKYFIIDGDYSEEYVQNAIDKALKTNISNEIIDKNEDNPLYENNDVIVIHGVHQFPPIYLRAIEEISKYKKVILLFNYQEQYSTTYQTWIDIYTAFDIPILFSESKNICSISKNVEGYECNCLSRLFGDLLEGSISHNSCNIDVIEFENISDFSDYISKEYDAAKKIAPSNKSPLPYMKEQFYGATSNVNDILKVYYPEQFGKRLFLDCPVGKFILALSNMWSVEENKLVINNFNLLKESLFSGVLYEECDGELINIVNDAESLLVSCKSLDECIEIIRLVKKECKNIDVDCSQLERISYCSIKMEDIQKLENALLDLDKISISLFNDFENQNSNISNFYKKLEMFLVNRIIDSNKFDDEFKEVTKRIIKQMRDSSKLSVSSTFDCLKETFEIYLVENVEYDNTAKWIVRNLEQIEGDILRTKNSSGRYIYHFCSLSDEDICLEKKHGFSWPLNSDFFEVAQSPVDWKYQVYVNSSVEYKNYRKFALLYALSNNYSRFKLSYIKEEKEREKKLFYPFLILGANIKKYSDYVNLGEKNEVCCYFEKTNDTKFDIYDLFRFRQCKYKFLLESIVEGKTVYKDQFLQNLYFEVLLESLAKEGMDGNFCDEDELNSIINEKVRLIRKLYPQILEYQVKDSIRDAKRYIELGDNFEYEYTDELKHYSKLKEIFLRLNIKDSKYFNKNIMKKVLSEISDNEVQEVLSSEKLKKINYIPTKNEWCKYCSNREICVKYYEK